jgi:hypothetical protein
MRDRGGSCVDSNSARHCAEMCWLNLHWWRHLANTLDSWGVRRCRVCQREEQAMYDSIAGMYWVRL